MCDTNLKGFHLDDTDDKAGPLQRQFIHCQFIILYDRSENNVQRSRYLQIKQRE